MSSKQDLLMLINSMRKEELEPLKSDQFDYYCNPDNKDRYTYFIIPKKSGKAPRPIAAPVKELKIILRYLNRILQALYETNKYAMGFVPGRSVRTNAAQHVNKNYVFNIDLKNFFLSIEKSRIEKTFIKQYNLAPEIADIIASLCCIRVFFEKNPSEPRYILPQGAPTSPIITNIICQKLDYQLAYLAHRFNATYSRYADDITFSSMHNIYQEKSEFMIKLRKIIATHHFKINPDKTRLQKKGSRQCVTGIVVNTKLNVTRKYIREIRSILYIWEKYGYDIAHERFCNHYIKTKGHIKQTIPELEDVLTGKLLYLKMIKGQEDSTYQTLENTFIYLICLKLTRNSSLKIK